MYNQGHSHAPWRKAWIVTLWAIQIFFLSIDVVILACLIPIETNTPSTTVKDGPTGHYTIMPKVEIWTIVNLVVAAICLFVSCVEVVIFQNRDLTPTMLVSSTAVKLVLWTGSWGYDFSIIGTKWFLYIWDKIYLAVALGFGLFIFISLLVTLIYASVVYSKVKKENDNVFNSYVAHERTPFKNMPYSESWA